MSQVCQADREIIFTTLMIPVWVFYSPNNLRNEMGDESLFTGVQDIEKNRDRVLLQHKTLNPEKYAIVRLYRRMA